MVVVRSTELVAVGPAVAAEPVPPGRARVLKLFPVSRLTLPLTSWWGLSASPFLGWETGLEWPLERPYRCRHHWPLPQR